MLNAILLSFFLLLPCLYLLIKLANPNKQNLPPSPPKLPLIGNLHQLGTLLHRSTGDLSAKYGPLMLLHFGTAPTFVISSAELTKEVTKNHDIIFAGRPQTRASEALFYGSSDIAFCPYGEYWRQVRKICVLELLSQKRVQEFHFVREEEVAKMVEKIKVSCANGVPIDLSEMLLTIANNIVSRSALGRAYEREDGDGGFGGLSRKAINLIAAFCFKDLFPSFGWMDVLTGLVSNLRDTSKALHDFLDQVIQEHQVAMNDEKYDKQYMVDILLHLQKDGMLDVELTRDNLKAILMDMFVGGTDTTAATMEWAMAELLRNPTVMRKAQEEVRRVVGDKTKLHEADISQMSYLKCIIKEALRLHAPAMIFRGTSASTKLQGYDIPAKARVFINAWAIQRDPKLWDRPEEFLPERFADVSVDFIDQNCKFIPFGFGRRICPGMSFAIAEAEFVLANLLYWFNWSLPQGKPFEDLNMDEANSLIVHKKEHLVLIPSVYSP